MIHEFALEPELVASWHDRARFRFFDGKFGLGTARIVSLFPRQQWAGRVFAAFERSFEGAPAAKAEAKKRVEALVSWLTQKPAYRDGNLQAQEAWLPPAVREHARRPFHAIVASARQGAQCAELLVADELDEAHERWSPERPMVLRTPAELTRALGPLIRCAREIRLVDPWFDASRDRYRRPLQALLAEAMRHRGPQEPLVVEIHTCITGRDDETERNPAEERKFATHLLGRWHNSLAALLPPGLSVSVIFWAEKTNGKDFHDRFVLTEVGGVMIGHGLDADDAGDADDVITILSRAQYSIIDARFRADATAYDRVIAPALITRGPPQRPAGRTRSGR